MYYEIKMTRMGNDEQGKQKKFNETYLIEAITIFEAVTKFEKYIQELYPDHTTVAIKQTPFAEILDSDHDGIYYHAKTNIVTIDERTAKESKRPYHMLIKAPDFDNAKARYEKAVDDWTADVSLGVIKETKIIEYIK